MEKIMTSGEIKEYLMLLSSAYRTLFAADALCLTIPGTKIPLMLKDLEEECRRTKRLLKAIKEEERKNRGERLPAILFVPSDDK